MSVHLGVPFVNSHLPRYPSGFRTPAALVAGRRAQKRVLRMWRQRRLSGLAQKAGDPKMGDFRFGVHLKPNRQHLDVVLILFSKGPKFDFTLVRQFSKWDAAAQREWFHFRISEAQKSTLNHKTHLLQPASMWRGPAFK